MNRSQRAVVSRIHRLEHVQSFTTSNFSHDDSIRTHTKAIDEQFPLGDLALTFNVGRARFETNHMILLEL